MTAARFFLWTGVVLGGGAALISALKESRVTRTRVSQAWHSDLTDLNSAPVEDLKRLGLDDVAANRIVENRPYRNKLELVSRMVIPETVYGDIRHHVGVRASRAPIKVA